MVEHFISRSGVSSGLDEIIDIFDWCNGNCNSEWKYLGYTSNGIQITFKFKFADIHDGTMFKIIWD